MTKATWSPPSAHSTRPTIKLTFGSHTEKFAYYGSVNGNRSDYGLSTPGPDVLHDRAWGLGGMTTLIYNRDANNQFRLVSLYPQRRLPNSERPGCADGGHSRSGKRTAMPSRVCLGCIRFGRV